MHPRCIHDASKMQPRFSRRGEFVSWPDVRHRLSIVDDLNATCYVVQILQPIGILVKMDSLATRETFDCMDARKIRGSTYSLRRIGGILGQRCRKAEAGNHWPEHLSHFLRSFHFHIFVCIFFPLDTGASCLSPSSSPPKPRFRSNATISSF